MASSMYYVYIKDWLKVIPASQFLFIKAEEYFEDREEVMGDILPFLGLGRNCYLHYKYLQSFITQFSLKFK